MSGGVEVGKYMPMVVGPFVKATGSSTNADECVEVAPLDGGGRAVRDTKDRGGPTLYFTRNEWLRFVDGVKAGEFDI